MFFISSRMTPTIQCFDDQSLKMPPASVLYNNLFFQQENQSSASDRINSSPEFRTNHQWTSYLKNRNLPYKSKRGTSYVSGLKSNINKLLHESSEEITVSEEHLDVIRKRTALLLVTIQTMTLFRHNQILEHKLSALHKRVVQKIQKERNENNESSSE